MNEFANQLQTLSERIVEALQEKSRESPAASPTAWELRLRLKTSLSQLYMALGMLVQEGRVRITPEGLTYRIRASPEPLPSSSEASPRTDASNAVFGVKYNSQELIDSPAEDKTLPATLKT